MLVRATGPEAFSKLHTGGDRMVRRIGTLQHDLQVTDDPDTTTFLMLLVGLWRPFSQSWSPQDRGLAA